MSTADNPTDSQNVGPGDSASSYIDPRTLMRIKNLQLRAKIVVEGFKHILIGPDKRALERVGIQKLPTMSEAREIWPDITTRAREIQHRQVGLDYLADGLANCTHEIRRQDSVIATARSMAWPSDERE